MKILFVLLVLIFCSCIMLGCVTVQEETAVSDGVTVEDGQIEEGAAMPVEGGVVEETEVEEEPVPAEEGSAVTWGDECENDFECSFSDNEDCEYGFCVVQECTFASDCPENNHCFNGECYSEAELYAEFPECFLNMLYCDIPCNNCFKGERKCILTGYSSGEVSVDYRICVECANSDEDCSEGYRCVDSYCVHGPE